jgi:hypothetical protein
MRSRHVAAVENKFDIVRRYAAQTALKGTVG